MSLPLACGHVFPRTPADDHPIWTDPGYALVCIQCKDKQGNFVPRQLALCAQLALYNKIEKEAGR